MKTITNPPSDNSGSAFFLGSILGSLISILILAIVAGMTQPQFEPILLTENWQVVNLCEWPNQQGQPLRPYLKGESWSVYKIDSSLVFAKKDGMVYTTDSKNLIRIWQVMINQKEIK